MKKFFFFANTPTYNYGNKIFAQHVSTLNWVLFRCSFSTNIFNEKYSFIEFKNQIEGIFHELKYLKECCFK
jgi:hypothetical protein